MAYTKPGISTQFLGAQNQFIIGPAARTVAIHATFPKGPDVPFLMSPATMGVYYGDPTSAASVGHYGPYMSLYSQSQAQPQTTGPIQFLVCRQNVVRGTLLIWDASSGVCFTLSAVGVYAGSASIYLQCAMTLANGAVTSITFTDSRTNIIVAPVLSDLTVGGAQDLSSNAKIVAAINATQPLRSLATVAQAVAGASLLVPATFHLGVNPAVTVATSFAAGSDGKASAFSDAVGSGGLLDQSLAFPTDYVTAAWDAATVATTLLAHTSAAAAVNMFRKLYLGPAQGTAYSTLAGSYATPFQSSRMTILAHDALTVTRHPVTGANWTWDGFVGAAALAGLKASGEPEQSCINMALNAFSSIGVAPNNTAQLSESQKNVLAGNGLTVLEQLPTSNTITVREVLTTIPQQNTLTGQRNIYSNVTAQEEDDAVADALNRYLRPLVGRPGTTTSATNMLIATAAQQALSSLSSTIAGNVAVTPYRDLTTGYIVCPVTYYRRDPVNNITLTIANTTAA